MKRVCLVIAQISLLSLFLSGCDTDNKSESLIEGATPTVSGLTMTYGLYPQANVNDPKLVSALNELDSPEINSWYLYEGNYYAKTVALARKDPRNPDFVPKFVKQFANVGDVMKQAFRDYDAEVKSTAFPDDAHSFKMKKI